MLCFKFSLIIGLLMNLAYAQKFNTKECLDAKYDTSIKHEGKFFGLIKNDLVIDKSQCIINIKYKNILETKWLIDICREPIHIKVTSKGSQNVYKRIKKCEKSDQTDYCSYKKELDDTMQDYGLIFAEGERENIKSAHGQTYCTYLLLKRYLDDGYLFSKYDQPANIFSNLGVVKAESSNEVTEIKETFPEVKILTPPLEVSNPIENKEDIQDSETGSVSDLEQF